jgi:hypothetical protein
VIVFSQATRADRRPKPPRDHCTVTPSDPEITDASRAIEQD